MSVFYVDRGSDQMRSTLIAFGLAHFLYRLAEEDRGIDVTLQDRGSTYELCIDLDREQMISRVQKQGLPELLPAILKPLSAAEKKKLDTGISHADIIRRYQPTAFRGQVVNYTEEKQKAEGNREGKNKNIPADGNSTQCHPEYPLWAHLCSYFGRGSAMRVGYPLALHIWNAHQTPYATLLCELILNCYSAFPNDIEVAQSYWREAIKPELNYTDFELFGWKKQQDAISALSVISPTTAQGSNTVTGAQSINTDTPNIFWLEIYLAFVGYMVVAMPFNSGGDVLVYYPIPRDIGFLHARTIAQQYRQMSEVNELYSYSGHMPRVKIDALNQILYFRAVFAFYLKNLSERNPTNPIGGLVSYYYKNLASHIPFDETMFNLPAWLPLEPYMDYLADALEILEAHYELICAIRGEYSEESAIIHHYRKFVISGDPDYWINFVIAYSQHRFKKMVDESWRPGLSLDLVKKTMMNTQQGKNYCLILENEGFRHIAIAIRNCTIQLHYFKDVKQQRSAFKVRHGLGNDLRRRAHNADEFIEDLSSFVHDYMRESSNVKVKTGESRPFITNEDLYQIITLVSEFGSRVIANLLVAVGYVSDVNRKNQES